MKFIVLTSISLISLLLSCSKKENIPNEVTENNTPAKMVVDSNGLSKSKIVIKTVHGNITLKLYPTKAPNTVRRFIELVNQDFYTGLTFHRVEDNFIIQGGDPSGNGTGGSGKKLKAEFNDIQHIKGTVAMVRGEDPDSADSQFYIALTTLSHLDRKYTVFAQVVEGFKVLSKIVVGDKMLSVSIQE